MEQENLRIFWTIWGISIKFSEKMWLMIISKVQSLWKVHFLKIHREWSQIDLPPPPPPPSSLFRVNNRPASLLKQETVTSFKVIKISWRSFSIWQLETLLQSEFDKSEVYPEPCQISKIKRFAKIVNGISSVIILQNAASLIIDRILNTPFKYGSLISKTTFFVHFHDMFLFKTMIKQSTLLSMCGIVKECVLVHTHYKFVHLELELYILTLTGFHVN